MKFSEVIGQKDIADRLRQLADHEQVPHALMLYGPRGAGKMALAMAFASYLLGEREEVSPQSANAVAMLRKWEHPDLHFSYPAVRPKNASSDHKTVSDDYVKEWHQFINQGAYFTLNQWMDAIGVENQQANIFVGESDALARKLSLVSSQGGYKIAIIWLPERMRADCANKMLKLLEEPTPKTIFIMVSEEPEKILETIRSRVQTIEVKRIDNESLKQALITQRGLDADSAASIAHIANGSWIKALEELDEGNEKHQFLEMFITLVRLAYARKLAELKKWTEDVASFGREKQKRMIEYFLHMIRENFVYNFQRPELSYITPEEEKFVRKFAPFINEANVIDMSEQLQRAMREIGQNGNAKIVFYDLALQFIILITRK